MNKELIFKGNVSSEELESLKKILNENIKLSRYESMIQQENGKLQIFYKESSAEPINNTYSYLMNDLKKVIDYLSSRRRIVELVSLEFELENEIGVNMVAIPENLEELFKQAKTYVTREFLKDVEKGNSLHLTLNQENKMQTMLV